MSLLKSIFPDAQWLRTSAPANHLELGRLGERMALRFLHQAGYRLVVRNYLTPIGVSPSGRIITGEIDIVAYDETTSPFTLTFVEVKTRSSREIASPVAAVDRRKQRHIIKAARIYRRNFKLTDEPFRYDVIGITITPDLQSQIELLTHFFNE